MRAACWASLVFAALGCSGSTNGFALGADLRQLPHAGTLPLVDLVPERAELALAVRDPQAAWLSIQGSAAFRALGDDLWRDAQALPLVERWRALQARLSELARVPVPGLAGLFDAPAVLAWVPGAADVASGWLYIAKVDESLPRVWAFARALNSVRPSARDVEVERAHGLPVRDVSIGGSGRGGSHFAYALLGDRLIVATDSALVVEAVGLAVDHGRALGARPPFADLEARAAVVDYAVAFVPRQEVAALPGLQAVELDGPDLEVRLATGLWRAGDRQLSPGVDEILRVDLPGLDGRALLTRTEAAGQPRDDIGLLLDRLAGLGASLDRGIFVRVARWQDGVGIALDAIRKGETDDRSFQLAAEALLNSPRPAEALGSATLRCSEDDEVCTVVCPATLRVAWPGAFARASGCPQVRALTPEAAAEATLWAGGKSGGLAVELRQGHGRVQWVAP